MTTTTAAITAHANSIAAALNAKFPAEKAWDRVYTVVVGRKYAKVCMARAETPLKAESVFLFVDAEGNVLKAEGWAKPAAGVRYNIATADGLAAMVEVADKFGSFLYAR